MGERLSRFGAGPKLVASVVTSAALAGALSYAYPAVCLVPALRHPAAMALALVLIALGLPIWLVGISQLLSPVRGLRGVVYSSFFATSARK